MATDASFVEGVYHKRYIRDGNLDALSIIEPVVTAHGLSLVETAMRWIIHHSALKMRTEGGNEYVSSWRMDVECA